MEGRAQRHRIAGGLDSSHVRIRHLRAIRLRIIASLVHGNTRLGGTVLGLGMERRGDRRIAVRITRRERTRAHAHARRLGIHELERIGLGVGRTGNGGSGICTGTLRLRIAADKPALGIQ